MQSRAVAFHHLEHEVLSAELATFAVDEPATIGHGDRPFAPGHDLRIDGLDEAGPDEAAAQPLAAALQRAALAASALVMAASCRRNSVHREPARGHRGPFARGRSPDFANGASPSHASSAGRLTVRCPWQHSDDKKERPA